MMKKGRTDEPLTTDAEVRNHRARRMAALIRKLLEVDQNVGEDDDSLAQWIAKCLLAHEVDTLSMLMDETRGESHASMAKADLADVVKEN
jgi:hypothetical protein